jgi:hypothetical protein
VPRSCTAYPVGAGPQCAPGASPAYRHVGTIIIKDETGACCGDPAGPSIPYPGLPPSAEQDGTLAAGPGGGKGGGRIGALILSPFVTPGTTSTTPYNHDSLLKSIEDQFALPHLGYAAAPGSAAAPVGGLP